MSFDEFFILFYNNIPTYLLSLLISAALMFIVFVKTHKSILDPLFYTLIMVVLANAVPVFLLLTDSISFNMFSYVFAAEAAFWFGFLFFYNKNNVFKNSVIEENETKDLQMFIIYFCMLVALKVIIYIVVGIPLFSTKSRLEFLNDSGGLGLLERLSTFPVFFCLFYAFKLFEMKWKYRLLAVIVLLSVATFSILSASKGAVLVIIATYFYYTYFYVEKVPSFKKIVKYIPLFILVPLYILSIQIETESPLVALLIRFVSNGDVYYMSLPDNAFDYVNIQNKFTYFFSGLLAPMRLIDIANVDTTIGFQLAWNINPMSDGVAYGPNTRMPVLAWIFFKWGGVFFSFVIGWILSLLYNKISTLFSQGIINFIIISYLQYEFIVFITDPVLGVGEMFNVIINLCLFLVIYWVLNRTVTKITYE